MNRIILFFTLLLSLIGLKIEGQVCDPIVRSPITPTQEIRILPQIIEVVPNRITPEEIDTVKVRFCIELPFLERPDGLPQGDTTHYRLFFDFGDGTYDVEILYAQRETEHFTIVPNSSNPLDSFLRFSYEHAYTASPTRPIILTAYAIKGTDHVPPPAMSIPAERIRSLIYTQGNQDVRPLEMLPTAEDRIFENTEADNPVEARTPEMDSTPVDYLRMQVITPPVRENKYVAILEIRNGMEGIGPSTALVHYNLPSVYGSNLFLIDKDSIGTWKRENISIIDLITPANSEPPLSEPFYPRLPSNLDSIDFSNVIKIEFDTLRPNELRRIIIPFSCPAGMAENTFDPVVFWTIFSDNNTINQFTERASDFIGFMKPVDSKNYVITESKSELIDISTSQRDYGLKGVTSGTYQDEVFIRRQPSLNTVRGLPNRLDYAVVLTDPLKNLLREISEQSQVLDTITLRDFVRDSYDPNSITVEPNCTPFTPLDFTGVVNFENYGYGPARLVSIRIPVPSYFDKFEIIESPSIGRLLFDKIEIENGQKYYHIVIDEMYLSGRGEIALKQGMPINEFDQIENTYGAVTTGFIKFKATLIDDIDPRDYFIDLEIRFDGTDLDIKPVTDQDTLKYSLDCGDWCQIPIFSFGGKLATNYNITNSNWNIGDNFAIGGFLDFRLNCGARSLLLRNLYLTGEASYFNVSYEGNNNEPIKTSSVELALGLKYKFQKFYVSGGISYLSRLSTGQKSNMIK